MRLAVQPPGELLDQPCLPEPGLAGDGDGDGNLVAGGPGVGRLEAAGLLRAAHQRHIEADGQRPQAGPHGQQEELVRSGAAGLDSPGREPLGRPVDQDRARSGGRREHHRPGPDVPGEAERTRPSDQRLTRRHPEAVLQAGTVEARQDTRLGGKRLPGLQAGPRGPEGIVLVYGGDAEHAHQMLAVAGGQVAAVTLEHDFQARDHLLVHSAVGFGVQHRTRTGRYLQGDAEHGDRPAGQRRPAGPPSRDENRVVAQDRRLEVTERRRRFQAQFFGQRGPELAIGLQGFGLAAAAVEGQHQLTAQPLPQRVTGHHPA